MIRLVSCQLLLELIGTGSLAVILDGHALGIVDDHGEIAVLRQHRRDIQHRPEKHEQQNGKSYGPQGDQPWRSFFTGDGTVEDECGGNRDRRHRQKPPFGSQQLEGQSTLLVNDGLVLEKELKNAH